MHSPGVGGVLWIMGLIVSGLGTILGAVNMITTILRLRAPGMTMFRLPLFTWNIFFTGILILLAFPILTAALFALSATGAVLLPFFSILTFLIAAPTGIKFFNRIGTMWKGTLSFETSMLWSTGFMVTFLLGGLTDVILAAPALDFHAHDTYFVVAHFHYVLFGTIVFTTLNTVSTIGSFVLGASMLPFIWNVVKSYRFGEVVEVDDPWGFGNSLEWATACPPPRHNFHELPRIRSERPAFELHYPVMIDRITEDKHVARRARRGVPK